MSILSGPRMQWAAIICAVLAVLCYAACYFLVQERVPSVIKGKNEGGQSIGKMLVAVFSNRALLGLIVAALLLLLTFMFLGQMAGFLFLSYFGDGRLQSPASLAALLPSLALIVISPWLAKRFGKAEVGIAAMLLGGLTFVLAYFMKIENAVLWIAFYAVGMFAIQMFNFLIWAFITDVIDYQEVRTGSRDDGTVYAVYSWARKLGQAFAGFLTGAALSAVNYDQVAAKAGEAQSQAAQDGVHMLANLLPGLGCIAVALALLFLYPLKKKAVAENVHVLRARRDGSETDGSPATGANAPLADPGARADGTTGPEGIPSDLGSDPDGEFGRRDG